jgi:hypothetical protein
LFLWCDVVMKRFWTHIFFSGAIIFTATALLILSALRPVYALEYGPQQVINAVNDLRAQYGLPPYDVSQALMEIAQQQANYMAEIQRLTHDRPDGSGVPTTAENIAFGPVNRAIGSWIDDQLHFDTLTGWSTGQVGVGIAQGDDGLVYISLNMNRYGDSVFTAIPYTLQPGVTPQPVPTQEPVTINSSVDETADNDQDSAQEDQPEEVSYLLPEEEIQENYPLASDKPVYLVMPEQQSQVSESKANGETTAYILLGVGVLGVIVSFIGLLYALRMMKANRRAVTKVDVIEESADIPTKGKSEPGDTSSSQEIPQEAQEE